MSACRRSRHYEEGCAVSEIGRVPDSTVFVLLSATGDLARRMVLPALSRLA
jgi:hypothetical protein